MVSMATLIYGSMWWIFARKNARRRDGTEDDSIRNLPEEEIVEMGDKSPRFLYTT